MLTRQHMTFVGGYANAFAGLLSVPIGHTQGCRPAATTFLSVQVARQHLHDSNR
jgi:hypothetical protein